MSLIKTEKLDNLSKLISKIEVKVLNSKNKSVEVYKDNKKNTKSTKTIKKNLLTEQQYIFILLQVKEYNISLISFQFLKNEYSYTVDESIDFFLYCKKNNLVVNNHFHDDNVHLDTKKVITYIDVFFGDCDGK